MIVEWLKFTAREKRKNLKLKEERKNLCREVFLAEINPVWQDGDETKTAAFSLTTQWPFVRVWSDQRHSLIV